MLRNLATNLVLHDSIETTVPKAKELRRVADKLVTLAKTDSHHNRRLVMKYLFAINTNEKGNAKKLTPMHRLFTEIAPRYVDRNGGYTRVIRAGKRPGDNADMAVIAFVEGTVAKKEKKKRRVRKTAGETAKAETQAEA